LNWDLDSDILHWHTLKRKQPNGGLIICNASLQLQQAPLKIEINLMSVPVYKALKNEEKEIPDHVFFSCSLPVIRLSLLLNRYKAT